MKLIFVLKELLLPSKDSPVGGIWQKGGLLDLLYSRLSFGEMHQEMELFSLSPGLSSPTHPTLGSARGSSSHRAQSRHTTRFLGESEINLAKFRS